MAEPASIRAVLDMIDASPDALEACALICGAVAAKVELLKSTEAVAQLFERFASEARNNADPMMVTALRQIIDAPHPEKMPGGHLGADALLGRAYASVDNLKRIASAALAAATPRTME